MSQFDDGLVIDRAISAFEEDGFVVLRAVLSPESVSACRHAALDLLEHYWQRIRDMGESLGLGQRGGFHEIVQRHTGRYEVQLGRSDHDRPLQELLSRVLGGPAFRVRNAPAAAMAMLEYRLLKPCFETRLVGLMSRCYRRAVSLPTKIARCNAQPLLSRVPAGASMAR